MNEQIKGRATGREGGWQVSKEGTFYTSHFLHGSVNSNLVLLARLSLRLHLASAFDFGSKKAGHLIALDTRNVHVAHRCLVMNEVRLMRWLPSKKS